MKHITVVLSAFQTIRIKLTLLYVALLATILIPFAIALYVVLQHTTAVENDTTLRFDTQHIIDTINATGNLSSLSSAVTSLPIGTVVVLYNRFGDRIEVATRSSLPDLPIPQPPNGVLTSVFQTVQLSNGEHFRVLTTPILINGRFLGLLQVAESDTQSLAALHQLALLLSVAVPVTLLIAILGGLFFAGRALSPIRRMTQTVRTMDPNDLSRRVPLPRGADELRQLAETFNALLDRLEQSFKRERQFTADASHELRTPLSILRTEVDLALAHPNNFSITTLESIRTEINHMQQLVNDLLILARAEHGEAWSDREPLRLDLLIQDAVDALEPLATARHIQLVAYTPDPIELLGDQTGLTQLIINLLDNALKYAPERTTVTITATRERSSATMRIRDQGPGIPSEHLPHIFERFYRVDHARDRHTGGTGLGLAIASWIVRSHGGVITATSTPGQGAEFTVILPLSASP